MEKLSLWVAQRERADFWGKAERRQAVLEVPQRPNHATRGYPLRYS